MKTSARPLATENRSRNGHLPWGSPDLELWVKLLATLPLFSNAAASATAPLLTSLFGLRTHEIFFCDVEELLSESNKHNTIRVGSETKTGERLVYPLKAEWVDLFELKDIQKPNIKLNPERSMRYISNNVCRTFRECSLGFIPYSLRHAWAIRSIHYKMNPSIAAKMMGHSVEMHTKNYHYYLSKQDMDKVYVDAIRT